MCCQNQDADPKSRAQKVYDRLTMQSHGRNYPRVRTAKKPPLGNFLTMQCGACQSAADTVSRKTYTGADVGLVCRQ